MKPALPEELQYADVEQKDRLLQFLQTHLDLDFTNYSEASVRRRVAKVLKELKFADVDSYIRYLQHQPNAREVFLEKFTVNVTEMFRDPDCYRSLTKGVFSALEEKDEIRIWSAGCSSGEEVVSLCILLHEHGLLERSHIIATDLSETITQRARTACYALRHVETYHKSYEDAGGKYMLEDYYTLKDDQACFDQNLLRNVDFRLQNLMKDPPAGKFDLIICRNVLIYFNAVLQNQVLTTFDNSLSLNGFLMTGSKESLIFYEDNHHFQETDRESRIYQKRS